MKKLLESIGKFIREVFSTSASELEQKAPLAVRLTDYIKEGIKANDGTIQWLLDRTASEKDNEAYEFFKNKLPIVGKELAIIDGLADENSSQEDAWNSYIEYIASKTNKAQTKEWIYLSGEILGFIITKKAPIQALIMAAQRAFQLVFGKN
jgi:hypothetical protein